ncbi:MAG: acylphosphatase [Oligoflexia bacterium]|nr:acylphosphatase [Oligoflexia bacterium]
MAAKRVLISGKVQGVGFRFHSFERAVALGLKGWVQNLPDGRVELVIFGESSAIDEMLSWAQKGPPSADVKKVDVESFAGEDPKEDFFIKR